MKILLINPSQEKVYGRKMMPAYPALGPLYIGSVLKEEGHQVRLIDIDTEEVDEDRFRSIFKDFNPDVIGVTSVTPTFNNALKWAGLAKQIKDVPVVWGGVHATIASEEAIRQDCVDILVTGEGELTAKELFNELASKNPNLEGIQGIYFKKGTAVIRNSPRSFIDNLDSVPFPDRTLLKKPRAFVPPDATCLPTATIITSRGCPGSCTFCCTKQMFSKRFRARSVENIIEEIESLVKNEHIKEIHIADDTFTVLKKRVLDFSREIKRRNINVYFQFMNGLRADFVDKEILEALKGIGIKTVGYGVESGNEQVLRNMKKNIPLDITRKAFKLSKELGFETWAFLMFGSPGETEETIKETIGFTKDLDPDFAKFVILKPYPGSEVHAQLKEKSLLLNEDYDNYGVYKEPVHRLPGLEPDRIVYWQKRAFREFYLRPRKIISHLKRIKSWTQFKLLINDAIFALYCMFGGSKKGG